MTAFRFRDPQLAHLAGIAAQLGATMHAADVDEEECEPCKETPPEHYATFGPTSNGTTDKPWKGAASRFSDDQYKMATAACDPGSGTDDGPSVKQGCFLPHHEPEGTININGVHAAAQRAGSLKGHDDGAVSTAKSHLRSHYAKLKEDPPESIQASVGAQREEFHRLYVETAEALGLDTPELLAELAEMFGGPHGSFSGTHSHPHSPYGSQGGDETHDHSHTHQGDNSHSHTHPASVEPATASPASVERQGHARELLAASFRTPTPADYSQWWEETLAGLAFVAGAQPGVVDPMHGAHFAVKQNGDDWYVLTAAGPFGGSPSDSYAEALAVIAQHLAEATDRPVLPQGWRSEMAFEGKSTGDGRFIEPGAIGYRDCPLPLMLQTETEAGHFGAVLCGTINQTGKLGATAIGSGDWDATDSGRQALQIVEARGRFGVSIDVAEAEGQPVCETHGQNLDACDFDCEWELHFSMIKVMGLTMTPFPAFEDAYIELATQAGDAQAADGWRRIERSGKRAARGLADLTAAGKVADRRPQPPAHYFERPSDWSELLVRQMSGGHAVPLTVEDPDEHGYRRVYGHVADRMTCHTGIPDRCQRAPMSVDGEYPGFNLRPIQTADGGLVKCGHITMGCGHASTELRLTPDQVRAHYDGAPGALSMAWVHASQDEHGPYVAGIINPARSDHEVEQFQMCSVSGDWRAEWAGRGYDLFAILAGVYVPGFTIAASLVAAGLPVPSGYQLPDQPAVEIDDNGEPIALVAMGVVRQPMPWERQFNSLAAKAANLEDRQAAADRTLTTLRPLAATVLEARLDGRDPFARMAEMFAAPTRQDAQVTSALQGIAAAVDKAIEAQAKDPDNGTDPDDKAVSSGLELLKQAIGHLLAAQAKDSDPEEETADA